MTPKHRNAPKTVSSSAAIQDAEVAQITRERDEALEQQAAASEVLQVIGTSPGDPAPVFATMLANAVRICDATFGNIFRWDGDALRIVARITRHLPSPNFAVASRRRVPVRTRLSGEW